MEDPSVAVSAFLDLTLSTRGESLAEPRQACIAGQGLQQISIALICFTTHASNGMAVMPRYL